jgi:DNA-binding MarR family transcriptional regulator
LVERRRYDDDRRVVYVEITAKANTLLEQMNEPLSAVHKELMGHMTRSELNELSRLLAKARLRM